LYIRHEHCSNLDISWELCHLDWIMGHTTGLHRGRCPGAPGAVQNEHISSIWELVKIANWQAMLRPAPSEFLGVVPKNLCFNELSIWFLCTLKFETIEIQRQTFTFLYLMVYLIIMVVTTEKYEYPTNNFSILFNLYTWYTPSLHCNLGIFFYYRLGSVILRAAETKWLIWPKLQRNFFPYIACFQIT
jgi:hypothetical protein